MQIETVVKMQRKFFDTNKTKNVYFRIRALERMEEAIKKNEVFIKKALEKDLNKSSMEAYMTEIGMVLAEITYLKRNVTTFSRPHARPTPLFQFHSRSFTVNEPYGCVLIMAPWNYPFMLSLSPLAGAIAAGNCCILKPSAYAPETSKIIEKVIKDAFPARYAAVIQGGRAENTLLLEQKFDYIFFTGSVEVGKLVMEKASRYLTPVTLELGGKSPCIVDESANLYLSAKRLVFGKYLNSGQTCVAPDYLLVQESVKDAFLCHVENWIRKMLGPKPLNNPDYPKMINEKHYDRVMHLITGENIYCGGSADKDTLRISPTVLTDVSIDAPIMNEEIFGPVLPVLTFRRLEEAIAIIHRYPKPLALYLFTSEKKAERQVLGQVSFGGGCINDTVIHLATSYMGFGGVGESGIGSYHGRDSLKTFSHKKSIIKRYNWIDLPIRYHPYQSWKEWLLKQFLR